MSGSWFSPPGLGILGGTGIAAPKVICQYCQQECGVNPGRIEITAPGDDGPCFYGCLTCLGTAVKEWLGESNDCKCSIRDLHISGCVCGAFKREQNAKAKTHS